MDFKNFKTQVQSEIRTALGVTGEHESISNFQISVDKHDSKSPYNQLRAVYGLLALVFAPHNSKSMNSLLRNPDEVRLHEHLSDLLNHRSMVNFAVIEELPH